MMALPPNWPQMLYSWNPGNQAAFGNGNAFNWTDLAKRMVGKSSTSRGLQFELDAIQPGSWQGSWNNTDGQLDPTNAASIFAPILPFFPWSIQAQYPPSINLLTPDQATAGEWSGLASGALPPGPYPANLNMSWFGASTDLASPGLTIVQSASAWQGSRAFSAMLQTGAGPANGTVPMVMAVPLRPLAAYSFSVYVRTPTSGASITVQPLIGWQNATSYLGQTLGTAVTLTGGTAWTRLAVSGICPANAFNGLLQIALTSTVSTATRLESDGWQFEFSSVPSPWAMPGPWYPIYTGQIERYPQSWADAGSYGTVNAEAVDVFALLSQMKFTDLMSATLMAAVPGTRPDFIYPFDDPDGSTSFTDFTGQRPAATSIGNAGLTAGVQQTSTNASGAYASAPNQTVIQFTPPSMPATGTPVVAPAVSIPANSQGTSGPSTTGTGWTRLIAFRATAVPQSGNYAVIWLVDGFATNTNFAYLVVNNASQVQLVIGDAYTSGTLTLGTVDLGDWHLAAVTMNAAGTALTGCLDGAITTLTLSPAWTGAGVAYNDDTVGALAYLGANSEYGPFAGNASWYAQWPTALTSTQLVNLYNTWRFAGAGESTGARYLRVLNLAGYQGTYVVDSGASQSLGPATDIANNDALTCLNNIVETENGQHFVDAAGVVTFYARTRRFLSTTPVYVFGENSANGEWPYDDVQFDFDPTHLGNLVQVTQVSTNQVTTAQDLTSQDQFGMRTLQRNNQSTSQEEINDAANFLLARYKQVRQRIATMVINPGAVPELWPVALSLELGLRIRVFRRPPGAPVIQFDGYIENIAWDTDDQNNATCTIEASPIDPMPYAAFTTLRSSLSTAISAGATSATLTALADAGINPAAANITTGQVLVLDPGLSSAESVTVASVSTTVVGYASFTVTFQSAVAHAHAAGAIVSEAFPGWTSTTLAQYEPIAVFDSAEFDAAVFDPVNVFDACAFSF